MRKILITLMLAGLLALATAVPAFAQVHECNDGIDSTVENCNEGEQEEEGGFVIVNGPTG